MPTSHSVVTEKVWWRTDLKVLDFYCSASPNAQSLEGEKNAETRWTLEITGHHTCSYITCLSALNQSILRMKSSCFSFSSQMAMFGRAEGTLKFFSLINTITHEKHTVMCRWQDMRPYADFINLAGITFTFQLRFELKVSERTRIIFHCLFVYSTYSLWDVKRLSRCLYTQAAQTVFNDLGKTSAVPLFYQSENAIQQSAVWHITASKSTGKWAHGHCYASKPIYFGAKTK